MTGLEYPRYCYLRDAECPSTDFHDAEQAAFMAYPGDEAIAHDMREVARRASARGMAVTTWEDLALDGRIVFCRICQAIMGAEGLWADITLPNQNVYFEIGFALARGRDLRLFVNGSRHHEEVELVEGLTYLEYENVEELLGKLPAPSSERSLAEQCRAGAAEAGHSLHALFLRRSFRTEAAQAVYRRLQDILEHHGVGVHVDDPHELRGHKLLQLTTLAARAQFVVANLARKDRKQSHLQNAGASLIAGYAMGAGVPLLVLQEKPADRMLDLKQVSREYATAKEALQLLDPWLEPLLPQLRDIAQEARQRRQTQTARAKRWTLDLGHFAAEYDRRLGQCFVENSAYHAALTGNRGLFVGRRGAGKTANSILLASALRNKADATVAMITPEKLQLREMIQEVSASLDRPPDPAVFDAIWRYVLCTEVASAFVRHFDQSPHLDMHNTRGTLAAMLHRIGCNASQAFDDRLMSALRRLGDRGGRAGDARREMLQQFHAHDVAELLSVLRDVPDRRRVFLLIDNLDQDWTPDGLGLTVGLIIGLLNEAQRLSHKDLPGCAHVVVFLREDIYQVASRYDPNADKKAPIYLRWDTASLLEMVATRIAATLEEAGQSAPAEARDVWDEAFASEIPGCGPSFEYLVERTMLRPRDVLQFCTRCMDVARQAGHGTVEAEDVLRAEGYFSRDLFEHLKQEYSVGYPDLEALGLEMMETPSAMAEPDFKARLQRAAMQHPVLTPHSIEDLFRFCYQTGIVGLSAGERVHYSFTSGLFDEVISRVRIAADGGGAPLSVVIHPGLRSYLETRHRQ